MLVSKTETCLTEEGASHSRTLAPGTLIIANSGATLGVAKILDIECCANDGIAALQCLSKNSSVEYIAHYINTLTRNLREVVATGNGQPNLNTGLIGSISLPFPSSIAEQQRIAEVLTDTDSLISSLEQLLTKKCQIKQGAMQELLTGQRRLPGFSGEWEVKCLGDIASFHKGKGLPKSALSPSGKGLCIHYGELFTAYGETISEIISRTDAVDGCFRSQANDVLMPTSDVTPNGLAKASCVTIDGVILGGDILVIRSDIKKMVGSYLSYVIRSEENQVLQLVTGTTVFHLYGSDMKRFTLSLPAVEEQAAISGALSEMDMEIVALEAKIVKARQIRRGMMQELLTGKIRLVSAGGEAGKC